MSEEFHRLGQVRARRSSRRKRRLRGLSTLGLAAVIITASQPAAPRLPARLLASRSEYPLPRLGRGASPAHEEARGRVEIVEPAAGLIRVFSGFLGLTSVELLVTDDTLIVVGDKEGGFGDIREAREVRAEYEVHPGTLRAKRLEVVTGGAPVATPPSVR